MQSNSVVLKTFRTTLALRLLPDLPDIKDYRSLIVCLGLETRRSKFREQMQVIFASLTFLILILSNKVFFNFLTSL